MPGKLEPADAQKAYAALLAAIEKTTDFGALRALAEGLKSVLGKLEPANAQKAYAASSPPSRKPPIPSHSTLAEGLKAVLGKLEPANAQKAYAALVAAIEKTTYTDALSALAEGLKAVLGKLEPADAQKASAALSPPSRKPPIPTHSARWRRA